MEKYRSIFNRYTAVFGLALCFVLLGVHVAVPQAVGVGQALTDGNHLSMVDNESTMEESPIKLFLPLVMRYQELSTIGTEFTGGDMKIVLPLAKEAGTSWLRFNGLLWSQIEAEEGTRDWSKAASLERLLESANHEGLQVILVVRSTPSWAQAKPPSSCGPIKADKYEAFASFMEEAVQRYSQPPYNVHYWELGNEPDVDPAAVTPDSPFGCWGDKEDKENFGGDDYADMLKAVVPTIRQADPQAKVLIGGLLLNCDPEVEGACESEDYRLTMKFFNGILKSGGAVYFDYVSFHGYNFYTVEGPDTWKNPIWLELKGDAPWPNGDWPNGGLVMGKVNYLRSLMESNGVNKPFMDTEAGLVCMSLDRTYCQQEPFTELQAQYLVWLHVRNLSEGIPATIWYTINGPGWMDSGLLDGEQLPKPAYDALQLLSQKLRGAKYLRQVSRQEFGGAQDAVGYEFSTTSGRLWVLFPTNEFPLTHPVNIELPVGTAAVYDVFGNLLRTSAGHFDLDQSVYIHLVP